MVFKRTNRREFRHRRDASEAATELLNRHLWLLSEIAKVAHLVPHGYEKCFPENMVQDLKNRYDSEAERIKHRPDYIVQQTGRPDMYLEYKVSLCPRFSERERQWDIVPIELASWDECLALTEKESRVALLVFCPYHARPLTCEFVGTSISYRGRQIPIGTTRGAGTAFMNVDLKKFRLLSEFLKDELGMPTALTRPLLSNFLAEARGHPRLKVEHDSRSKDKGKEPKWLDP